MSNTIKIYDFTESSVAETMELGDKVFNSIKPLIENSMKSDMKIVLDFSGITSLTTKFLNNAIGNLFLTLDAKKLLTLLNFTGLDQAKKTTLKWSLSVALANSTANKQLNND
ncbi:STAS-like domain-containing protein [Clostridium celatum]|uniref:STAS-like domain-containing protein n=1 Tax=Clostridium celatum TaxID=36834 RepID=UPI001896A69E|nr:STAS-like domain-containing protein [Clostridium celatum]